MTVNYNLCVATSRPWTLIRLLLHWRGSFWKAIGVETGIWLLLFYSISAIYHHVFTVEQQREFGDIVTMLDKHLRDIPLDFMLGFFVSLIVRRWSELFRNIGLIENLAHMISGCIRGGDDKTKTRRRNIIRYCVVAQILAFRDISVQVRKRFPTIDAIAAAGFLLKHEKEELEGLDCTATNTEKGCLYGKTWIPIQWAISLLKKARYDDVVISTDMLFIKCVEEVNKFRTNLLTLSTYDWVPIPIMYPQLVFLAVHLFFFIALFSRQFSPQEAKLSAAFVIPLMACLQFTFYMGWLKVAEVILNPFGEDDDDFELNFLLDRNLIVGLAIVDDGNECIPEQEKDAFWEAPVDPLYSTISMERESKPLAGSVSTMDLCSDVNEITMVPLRDRGNEYVRSRQISIVRSETSASSCTIKDGILSRFRRRLSRMRNSVDATSGDNFSTNTINDRQLSVPGDIPPSWNDSKSHYDVP
ncbi:hypothetical protein Q1695_004901 [Nippostrongylus brasiliensis]|nr:hypothetical protein Q1695_004901 [Nippostrongylus brasiliensis]